MNKKVKASEKRKRKLLRKQDIGDDTLPVPAEDSDSADASGESTDPDDETTIARLHQDSLAKEV